MEVFYKNSQWAVTDYGLESVDRQLEYDIEANRLDEMFNRGRGLMYDWPIHMTGKKWVDLEEFIDAFVKALDVHSKKLDKPINENILGQSIEEARRLWLKYQR